MPHCSCGGRKTAKCVVCGSPRGKKSLKYCPNKQCQALGQHAVPTLIAAWLRGEIKADVHGRTGDQRRGLANWARLYLLNEAEHKCSRCGWDEPHPITGKPPLEVDHIDGDRCNNERSNLRVLCPNCHSLTPTFRRYNYRQVQALKMTKWVVQADGDKIDVQSDDEMIS